MSTDPQATCMMLWALGAPLTLAQMPMTLPAPGYQYIELRGAALNKRDWWISQGRYPGIVFPVILGSDGSGIQDGRRVLIDPAVQWGSEQSHFGPGFRVLGMPDAGTLSTHVKVANHAIHAVPDHLDDIEAAALPLAGVTAYRALFYRGEAKPGQKVLITGIGGGVALMALQMSVAHGMEVWVTSGDDAKIQKAKALGASGGVNYSDGSWIKALQKSSPGGFDLIIDGAGGSAISQVLSLMKPLGKFVIYGGTQGPIQELIPQRIFWKELEIRGSTMGSPYDFAAMLDYVTRHRIKPVVAAVYALEKANEALQFLASGQHFGKVCIEIS